MICRCGCMFWVTSVEFLAETTNFTFTDGNRILTLLCPVGTLTRQCWGHAKDYFQPLDSCFQARKKGAAVAEGY